MTFEEVLDQAIEMLRRRGRVTYRALQRQFGLDDAYLADLKAEIIGSSPRLRPSAKARHTRRGYVFAYCVHFATRTPFSGSA